MNQKIELNELQQGDTITINNAHYTVLQTKQATSTPPGCLLRTATGTVLWHSTDDLQHWGATATRPIINLMNEAYTIAQEEEYLGTLSLTPEKLAQETNYDRVEQLALHLYTLLHTPETNPTKLAKTATQAAKVIHQQTRKK